MQLENLISDWIPERYPEGMPLVCPGGPGETMSVSERHGWKQWYVSTEIPAAHGINGTDGESVMKR